MKKKKIAFGKDKKKDEEVDKKPDALDETTELPPEENPLPLWHPRPSND